MLKWKVAMAVEVESSHILREVFFFFFESIMLVGPKAYVECRLITSAHV